MGFMSNVRMALSAAQENLKVVEAYKLVQRFFDVELHDSIRKAAYYDVLEMAHHQSVSAMAVRYLLEYGRYVGHFYDQMTPSDRELAGLQFTGFANKVGELQGRGEKFDGHLLSEFLLIVVSCGGDSRGIKP